MEPTIRVQSQQWPQQGDEQEFQGILRRYEVREQVEGRIRTLGGLYLAISAVGLLAACIAFVAIAPWVVAPWVVAP